VKAGFSGDVWVYVDKWYGTLLISLGRKASNYKKISSLYVGEDLEEYDELVIAFID
jgi:hypothetical protein